VFCGMGYGISESIENKTCFFFFFFFFYIYIQQLTVHMLDPRLSSRNSVVC
jgi:hypothetical protein